MKKFRGWDNPISIIRQFSREFRTFTVMKRQTICRGECINNYSIILCLSSAVFSANLANYFETIKFWPLLSCSVLLTDAEGKVVKL
jgi:hypothetical protein